MMQPFFVALQFLTRLPVSLTTQPTVRNIGNSLLFYPLIGIIIGMLLAGLGWIIKDMPSFVAAALIITFWIILSGGLHLDGLADSADAWIGGMGNREKTLAIMKDPNCGPSGATAIILVILLKFAALHSLFIIHEWVAIVFTTTLARMLILLLFLTTPYVRSNGLGSVLAVHQPRRLSLFIIAATPVPMLWIAGINYFWLPLTAILTFLVLRYMMMQRINGTTGDTAGALIELTETGMILMAVLTI